MAKVIQLRAERTLDQLAVLVDKGAVEYEGLSRRSVEKAWEIGGWLVEAKPLVKAQGGTFGAWLEARNIAMPTAYRFISLRNSYEQISQVEKFDNVTDALDTARKKGRATKLGEDEQRVLSLVPSEGRVKTIVIDPPWDHEGFSLAGRGRPDYATMTHDELLALDLGRWTEEPCHLYLWTTNNFLLNAGELLKAWGFEFKTVLTWVKPRFGLGSYFRSSTEHVLFGVKGKLTTRVADIPTHFEAPLGEHSAKPEAFYELVKRASYPPYGEVFQRDKRDGFANLFSNE